MPTPSSPQSFCTCSIIGTGSYVPERVLTGTFPNTFRLALLHKDAGIAAQLLRETGVEGPVLELACRLYGEAREVLGEEADYLEAIRITERQAGVEIRG